MTNFKKYASVYDALNMEKDYRQEAEDIKDLIQEFSIKKDVLMLGCGTGRHDRELTKYGYKIDGVDMSSEMIRIAEESKVDLPLSYEVGDIRTYENDKKYNIILSLFHVLSYQTTNEDLLNTFETVERHLTADGIFIFDAWYGVGVLRDLPAVRVKRVETGTAEITRIAEPVMHLQENIVDVNYDIHIMDKDTNKIDRIQETHRMRYLFTPEIKKYLELKGLKLVQCLDCKTLKTPNFDTWTAYFIVTRR